MQLETAIWNITKKQKSSSNLTIFRSKGTNRKLSETVLF